MGLPQNLLRNERLVVRNDATSVDNLKRVAAPFRFAIDAIARDARLVSDNGAARAGQAIEKRGLADIGAAHYYQRWQLFGHGCEPRDTSQNSGSSDVPL